MQKLIKGFFLCILLAGCAGTTRPSWVPPDTPAFVRGKAFYGVGTVSGIHNPLLAQMTAEALARAEVEKSLDDFSKNMMKAYRESLSAAELKKIEEDQNLTFTFRTYVAMSLFDASVEHSWTDAEKDTVSVVMQLKLSRFIEKMRNAEGIDPGLRKFIKENAKDAFERYKTQHGG